MKIASAKRKFKPLQVADDLDKDAEVHVLTDKAEVKIVGCRVCQRPCVVTRFAAPAKVACEDHRDRHSVATKVSQFNDKLEPHVLTDKDKTKDVPCRTCGRRCTVTTFATPEKVACNECRTSVASPRRRTIVEADENGRARERVEYEQTDPADLAWSKFALSVPMYAVHEYTDDERDQRAEFKAARSELAHQASKLRSRIAEIRRTIAAGVPVKVADQMDAEREELEPSLAVLDQQIKELEAEFLPVARRAFLRSLVRRGWTVRQIPDDGMELERTGSDPIPLPPSYISVNQLERI